MKKIALVTGGLGFVGSHFIEHIWKNTDWDIVSLDRLDTSGNPNRIVEIDGYEQYKSRLKIVYWDLKSAITPTISEMLGPVNYVFHLAAGSHVDRSITNPMEFVYDNVVGTGHLLDWARNLQSLEKFAYFSTDEVFGPAPKGVDYKEWDRYNSGNPYSATKAGAEELCLAFANTYKMPIYVSHCMNIMGPRQHPEKFIPMSVKKILNDETIFVHADKTKTFSGSRFYIHAEDVASASLFLLNNAECLNGHADVGKYNIRGEEELTNLQVVEILAEALGMPFKAELVDFHSSRPGHDLRYALDGELLFGMGWKHIHPIRKAIADAAIWYRDNSKWLAS